MRKILLQRKVLIRNPLPAKDGEMIRGFRKEFNRHKIKTDFQEYWERAKEWDYRDHVTKS